MQCFADRFPPEMRGYFDLRWRPERLWDLDLPVRTAPVDGFLWHLEYPFWASNPPDAIFDLCPGDVLANPAGHAARYARIRQVDTSFALETAQFGSRIVVLDGLHRLANCVCEGRDAVRHRIVPHAFLAKGC